MDETSAPRNTIQVLRAAAEVVRRATRDLPRGPWRWGDPDVGEDVPDVAPLVHRASPGPPLPRTAGRARLDEPLPSGMRDVFGTMPDDAPLPVRPVHRRPPLVLDPALAEPLATLLELIAGQVERDDGAAYTATARAAEALAQAVLRSAGTPTPHGPGHADMP